MFIPRVIPVLLLQKKGLVKTVKFKDPVYVGDYINAIRIFNEKEADELIFLDIDASKEYRGPFFETIKQFASECFMPVTYGGGITSCEEIRKILKLGIEKVAINTAAISNPSFIKEAVSNFGSSTIVVSIDVKKNILGKYQIYSNKKIANASANLDFHLKQMEQYGVGEILINAVDQDGMMKGMDIPLIKKISQSVTMPVVACGGAVNLSDIGSAIKDGKASAVAAGSMFVFHGKHKAVLITYPSRNEILNLFQSI
jgi:cyclase